MQRSSCSRRMARHGSRCRERSLPGSGTLALNTQASTNRKHKLDLAACTNFGEATRFSSPCSCRERTASEGARCSCRIARWGASKECGKLTCGSLPWPPIAVGTHMSMSESSHHEELLLHADRMHGCLRWAMLKSTEVPVQQQGTLCCVGLPSS